MSQIQRYPVCFASSLLALALSAAKADTPRNIDLPAGEFADLAVAPSARYWQDNPDGLTHIIASFVKSEQIAPGLPVKVPHLHATPQAEEAQR